jgi:hypothetical protein
MRKGSSEPGRVPLAGATGAAETQTIRGQDRISRPRTADPTSQPTPAATEAVPAHAATDVVRHGPGVPATAPGRQVRRAREQDNWTGQPTETRLPEVTRQPTETELPEVVRYGPGVPATPPAGQPELTAERVWRANGPGKRSRLRVSRLAGWTLTLTLLVISGVLLYPRIHHAPFHVTGVAITQRAHNGCGVDLTGQITTNGSAGTVSYQWLFQPSQQPPQPLSQSVLSGQRAVYVTVAVNGAGQGSASQTVTLQVLGPDTRAASAVVAVSCR